MNKVGMLVQKDLIYLSTSLKQLVFMSVVFAFVFPAGNITLALAVPSMVVYLLTYGVFAYEEKNKVNLLNISLPVDRKALCASKYLTGLIYAIATSLITLLGAVAGGRFLGTNTGDNTIGLMTNTMFTLFAIALIYNSMILPGIIYFGTLKMKYVVFALYFVSFIILGVLGSNDNLKQVQIFLQKVLTNTSSLMILAGSVIVYIISYVISINLYAHKEFK